MTPPITPETVTRAVLENGLVVLVKENHTNSSVSLRGRVRAGGMYETDRTAGLAQFAAAALSRGTENFTFRQLNETFDGAGMTVGAGAGTESASLYGKALVEDLDLLLDVAGELLLRPTFPESEVKKLRGQLATHMREAKQDTRWVAAEEFHRLCYPSGHPYHRLADGTEETISRISEDKLAKFHSRFYRPEGVIFVVVGDVTAQETVDKIRERFSRWKGRGGPPGFEIPSISLPTTPAQKHRVVPGKMQTDIKFGYPGIARNDPDYYALRTADLIFGQMGLFGRLGQVIRDRQGLAYYVYSGLDAGLGAGPWTVSAGVNPKNVDRAIEEIKTEIERLRENGVDNDELTHAQDYLTGLMALRLETNEGVASTLLDIEFFGLGLDYILRYPSIIRGLTVDRLRAAVAKHTHLDGAVTVTAGPPADGLDVRQE
jgi:zinc protease